MPLLLYRECGEISLCHCLKSSSERCLDEFFFKVMIPIQSILNSKESNMNIEEASGKSKTAKKKGNFKRDRSLDSLKKKKIMQKKS